MKFFRKFFKGPASQQMELPLTRARENDRNHHLGGRSFYFFDIDDNIAVFLTPMFLVHKKTKKELEISTVEFSLNNQDIGVSGKYKDYKVSLDGENGTFRNFRDRKFSWYEKLLGKEQQFLKDLKKTIDNQGEALWKGPSWDYFYHAVYNKRPIALITARGHSAETIKEGISVLVKKEFLPCEPNYLDVYPVNNSQVRKQLGGDEKTSTAELKRFAIFAAVEKAMELYGENEHHRFGMSDDDFHNLREIEISLKQIKTKYPRNAFFSISTHNGVVEKREILLDQKTGRKRDRKRDQISLF